MNQRLYGETAQSVSGHDRHLAGVRNLGLADDEVQLAVLVQIGRRERARPESGGAGDLGSESPGGIRQKDPDRVGTVVGDGDVQPGVGIELADGHGVGTHARGERPGQCEHSGPVATKDLDGVRAVVHNGQVEYPIIRPVRIQAEIGSHDLDGAHSGGELPQRPEPSRTITQHRRDVAVVDGGDIEFAVAVPVAHGDSERPAGYCRADFRPEATQTITRMDRHLLAHEIRDDEIGEPVAGGVGEGDARGYQPGGDRGEATEGAVAEPLHQAQVPVIAGELVGCDDVEFAVPVEIDRNRRDRMTSHDEVQAGLQGGLGEDGVRAH